MKVLRKPFVFQWNRGNKEKNWTKHKIGNKECEEVFFDKNKKIVKDSIHSNREKRFILLGKTKEKRILFIVFTIRAKKIRIISARKINKKEVFLYEKRY